MTEVSEQKADSRVEACPICGARSWQELFVSRTFSIARCLSCSVVRTLAADMDGVVQYPHFDQRETIAVRMMRLAVTQLLRERAALVHKVAPRARRLLDIGCGAGAFARMMSERGLNVTGVEPFSLGRPIDEENLRLVRASFDAVKRDLGSFDVVTMWQVLEHVADPRALVRSALDVLATDGVLVVSVPNFDSWQSRVFKGGWFHLDPPRHVTHFDPHTLRSLMDELDLEIFDERTFHIEYGPVGWLQSALNRILRPNFLYEFVKDRGALANVPKSETALNLAVSGAAGVLLAIPSILVEVAAGISGAGSVVTVAVRRRIPRGGN